MELALIIIAGATLIVVSLDYLSSKFGWFVRSLPIQFGFLHDGQIASSLKVSTGDPAKRIELRFYNPQMTTLVGIVLDIRFMKPLALSGTKEALTVIPGKSHHGRVEDERFYWIRHFDMVFLGKEAFDFRVELNTQGLKPGTYQILANCYSNQQSYKLKEFELSLIVQ